MDRFVMKYVESGVKFDLKAPNGQAIVTSEVYRSEAACRKGMDSVVKNAPKARLEDLTQPQRTPLPCPKFELYQDRAGEYRFRLKARNGEIIAVSDGYSTRSGCRIGIESVQKYAAEAAK